MAMVVPVVLPVLMAMAAPGRPRPLQPAPAPARPEEQPAEGAQRGAAQAPADACGAADEREQRRRVQKQARHAGILGAWAASSVVRPRRRRRDCAPTPSSCARAETAVRQPLCADIDGLQLARRRAARVAASYRRRRGRHRPAIARSVRRHDGTPVPMTGIGTEAAPRVRPATRPLPCGSARAAPARP